MIRLGQGLTVLGILMLILPFGNLIMCIGFIVIGIGCAPIYPCVIHQTPIKFGAEVSQAMIGMQMACAYTGSTLMPPFFGLLVDLIDIKLYPFYLIFFVILMIIMMEKLNHTHTIGEKLATASQEN
jgi:MFS family permease